MATTSKSADQILSDQVAAPESTLTVRVAFVVAALALAGSLFLSVGMHLKACPLCFYQRTFVMSLVAVLGLGLLVGVAPPGRLSLLACPLAVAGLGVAGFHVWLEVSGRLECPQGVLGLGSAPQQSLGAFVVLSGLLSLDAVRSGGSLPHLLGALLLGAALAIASCVSNPPMPDPPATPYPGPPEVCRPPYSQR